MPVRSSTSTTEAAARHVQATGATTQTPAAFGDDHHVPRGTLTAAA